MTAFIILREALLKNNNIGVIKSLKLMNFKCKNNLQKYSRSRSTFRNKFDPSLELLLLRYFRECKCVLNEIHSFAEVSKEGLSIHCFNRPLILKIICINT